MARALSHSVKLLILDEPSAVLDDVEVDALFGVVRRLTAEGVGVIWISHRLGEVAELGDVATVLKGAGRWPPSYRRHAGRHSDQTHGRRAHGRRCSPTADHSREETVLEVRGLTRAPDVYDASLTLREGEILGLAGLVGSGSYRA